MSADGAAPGEQQTASPASLRDAAVRGTLWAATERWGARGISTATFVVIARHVAPADFGLVALSGSVTAVIAVLQEQGFGLALVQRAAIDRKTVNTAFWTTLGASIVLAAVLAALAAPLGHLMGEPDLAPVLRVQACGVVIGGLASTPVALLRRSLRFKPIAVRRLVATVAGSITGITMAVSGFGVWALVAQALVDASVSVVILWIAVDWVPRLEFSGERWRELASFGFRMVGTNLLNVSNRRLDDLLIGVFLGSTALGYYSVAYRLLLAMTELFIGTLDSVAVPAFSRVQNDPARTRRALYSAVRWACALAMPAFLGVAAVAPEVVTVAFGPEWQPSITVMRILALSGALHAIQAVNTPVLIALGKPQWVLRLTLVTAALNAAGFSIGLRWGIVGVASAFVIRAAAVSPLPLLLLRQLIGLDLKRFVRQLLPIAISATAMALTAVAATTWLVAGYSPLARLAAAAAIGAAVYVALLRMCAPAVLRDATRPLGALRPAAKTGGAAA